MARHGESKHFKRSVVAKSVVIPRKKYKYYIRNLPGKHENEYALSLLGLIRDISKIAQNSREANYLIRNNFVKVDGKPITEPKYNVGFGDIISIKDENFIVWFEENGKFVLKPYNDPNFKKLKVVSIHIGKGAKQVLFTNDGRNIISDKKVSVGDTIILNLKDRKIERIIPFEQGREAIIYKGKNVGKYGKIEEISKDIAYLSNKGNKIAVLSKFCMVI